MNLLVSKENAITTQSIKEGFIKGKMNYILKSVYSGFIDKKSGM